LDSQLLENLVADWGYVMGSMGLRKALGFSTQQALRRAIQAGRVPFIVFTIEGRKGPFARTHDVATWLASRQPRSLTKPEQPSKGAEPILIKRPRRREAR